MKVSGFTFIRNGHMLGFPFVESIKSVLPICDEFIVNVGVSDDDTLEMVKAIDDAKIKITKTRWNDKMRHRGFVYAQQKMIAQYKCTGDWLFYIEGDEIVHEEDLPQVRAAMEQHLDDPKIEALVFDYFHFYGNINTYVWSPAWYRRATRIIKSSVRAHATDGLHWFVLGKRDRVSRYPRAALTGAPMYHYGWVRPEAKMVAKLGQTQRFWGKDGEGSDLRYAEIDQKTLRRFVGTHPKVVEGFFPPADGVYQANPNHALTRREQRHRVALKLERWFDLDLSKKFHKIVPPRDDR